MMSIMETLNASSGSNLMVTDHPYYPIEVEIASYLANEWSVPILLGIFAAACTTILVGTQIVVNKAHPHLPSCEKAAIWWFVLCRFYNPTCGSFRGVVLIC